MESWLIRIGEKARQKEKMAMASIKDVVAAETDAMSKINAADGAERVARCALVKLEELDRETRSLDLWLSDNNSFVHSSDHLLVQGHPKGFWFFIFFIFFYKKKHWNIITFF